MLTAIPMGEEVTEATADGPRADRQLVRLDVLRFPLIVLIVYLHACGFTANFADGARALADGQIVATVQAITGSIGRIGVPLFFLMSGFLFFRGGAFSSDVYRAKLKSRARSLLVPFLFWNLALLALVAIAQSTPSLAPFFNGQNQAVRGMSAFQLLDAVFGFTRYPISYQFWFIRDLMLLVVASPVIWFAARYLAWPTFFVLAAVWLTLTWPMQVPESEPVVFFYLGSMVAIRGGSLFAVDRLSWWLVLLFPILLTASYAEHAAGLPNYFLHPAVAVGVILALKASRWLAESDRLRDPLVWLGGASFFVYATHEPLITIGKKIAFRAIPMSAGTVLTIYAVLPALVICLGLLVYWAMAKSVSGFLRIITGGR